MNLSSLGGIPRNSPGWGGGGGGVAHQWIFPNVALKYAVKVRRHTQWSRVRCHGCRFTHRQFHSQFHSRRHSLRITLKYTTLVCMRSSNAWTMKPWQRSEWRLGFNTYSRLMTFLGWEAWIQELPPPPPNMPLSSLSYQRRLGRLFDTGLLQSCRISGRLFFLFFCHTTSRVLNSQKYSFAPFLPLYEIVKANTF